MTVYKDEKYNTWYFSVRYKDSNGRMKQTKRRGFQRKRDAVKAQTQFLDDINKKKNETRTFNEIVNDFKNYSIGRKKDRTIINQNNLIDTVLSPYFGNMKIDEISPSDVDTFYRSIINNYSNASMKTIRRSLSSIMNFAVNFYDLRKNVVNIVELPKKEETNKIKYWTLEQFNEFRRHVKSPVQIAMFEILFWSGIRKGELLALRFNDIDFDNNLITISRSWNGTDITSVKTTPSDRTISVPNHVIDSIRELIEFKKHKYKFVKKTDYLFTGRSIETPFAPANVNSLLKRIIAKTDLPEIRVHYFRHSHASMLINSGVSLYVVSRHLGHSDIQTTANIYGHLYPNTESEIGELLNNIYKNSEQNF